MEKEEEGRIKEFKKAIDSTNTLQESLEKEKERLNAERLKEQEGLLDILDERYHFVLILYPFTFYNFKKFLTSMQNLYLL